MEQLQSLLGVTGFYAGILGLLFVLLSVRVSQARQRLAIGISDGGNPEMTRVIRVHANFAEYGPMALILLAVIGINGASIWLLHVLGVALVAIRAEHA
ncbi:MAG: glutathione metabolism protein [Alphaproteobacteria bacterium]|nr:glutathione metabolism protein [Alphaproteobacteria bacterium]